MPLCVSTTALADPARETTAERVDNLCPIRMVDPMPR